MQKAKFYIYIFLIFHSIDSLLEVLKGTLVIHLISFKRTNGGILDSE